MASEKAGLEKVRASMAVLDVFRAGGDFTPRKASPAIVPEVIRLLCSSGYTQFRPGEYAAPSILVVDEWAKTADAMVRLLTLDGYSARSAGGCGSARAVGLEGPFDLLLTDLEMADGDGCDLLREMRDLHGSDGIAVTACRDDEVVLRCRAAGFLYHLTKPTKWERVAATVSGAMAMRRKRTEEGDCLCRDASSNPD